MDLGGADRPFETARLTVRVNEHSFSETEMFVDLLYGLDITVMVLTCIFTSILIALIYFPASAYATSGLDFPKDPSIIVSMACCMFLVFVSLSIPFSPCYLNVRIHHWLFFSLVAIGLNLIDLETEDGYFTMWNITLMITHSVGTFFVCLGLGELWRISLLQEGAVPHGETIISYRPAPDESETNWLILHTMTYVLVLLFQIALITLNSLRFVGVIAVPSIPIESSIGKPSAASITLSRIHNFYKYK